MKRNPGPFVTAVLLLYALLAAETAFAQKPGGVLTVYHRDSPASMSRYGARPLYRCPRFCQRDRRFEFPLPPCTRTSGCTDPYYF